MTAPSLAIFRADAAPAIGGGHAMRCLTLADALAEAGWTCGFAVREGTLATVPALGRARHEVHVLTCGEAREPAALAARWPDGAHWLIVDHYGRDAAFERACRPWAARILSIDDLADRAHDCDLLLDQTLGRRAQDYAGLVPGACRLLLGPRNALLRPAFAARRAAALARREGAEGVRRVLVSLGATDPANATGLVLEGIGASGLAVEVDAVLGAGSSQLPKIKALAERLPLSVRLHVDAEDMAGLMAQADLSVGAAGATSWERCCLGLPTLMVIAAENQRLAARQLEEAGAATLIGEAREDLPAQTRSSLVALAEDPARQRCLSQAAAALTDGRGAARLIHAMQAAG